MELPLEYPELTDSNLSSFSEKWEPWDRLAVTKCIKEIKPKHIRHLASSMKKLKFTNLNTFRNLKTLLDNFPHIQTLLFHDACFDKFRRNKLEKMVFHERITHIVITSTTTISTKEHWIIEFLMEEVNFPNLLSLRIQKFYSLIPLQGEVEEIMQKYNSKIDDNLVTKFVLKNRHGLRELELGGPGLKMAVKFDNETSSKRKPAGSHDRNVMTDAPTYQASAVQYDPVGSTSKALQYEEGLSDAQTESFTRPLEKFIARLKATKEKEERLKNSAPVQEIFVSPNRENDFNSLNSFLPSLTRKSDDAIQDSCPCLKADNTEMPDENSSERRNSCPCVGESTPKAKFIATDKKGRSKSRRDSNSSDSDRSKSKDKKRRSHSREGSDSRSSDSEDSGHERSSKNKSNRETRKEKKSKSKALTDFEKMQTLALEKFIFSYDAPGPALKSILESQRSLKTLRCTHVFLLQGMFNIESTVELESITASIIVCIRKCEDTLTEITLDPTMIIDASHETLKGADYLQNLQIDGKIFADCTALKILKLGLQAFRRVSHLGIPSLAILMGTKVTSLQRIPSFQLEELSLALEDYSRDEFEQFAKNFGSFIQLKRFYFGTSTLKPENTFMIRYDYLYKLFHLPLIEIIIFHNSRLENPELVKTLVDSYPNGAVITINFDIERISFEFDRSLKKKLQPF